ncbi:tripartite tricarboxylate transporter TctB family protein [Halorubrum amylolyticum]|uniref:tripartite tricarboxylate transporter TctB family protein n=1 Tax=Halorubrum amylolyticum TaxID=2508724 RepID=UPI0010089099|nr:tripartite tricarboxylate transporter TctB family protein [Halorubrum amylolyticum]
MSRNSLYRRLSERFDQERFLLIVFILGSGIALAETFRFDISSAARFPRLTGSVVFVGALLLFFSKYLPGPIRAAVEESSSVFEADEEFEKRQQKTTDQQQEGRGTTEPDAAETDRNELSTVGRPIHDSVFTGLIATGYAALGFAIGILWATPIFVVVYGYWFKLPRYLTAVLAVIGFAIAYGFMSVLGVPLDRGQLLVTSGVF